MEFSFFNDNVDHLDVSIFPEGFEAWVHGPVNRHVYAVYANYRYHEIEKVPKSDAPNITNPDLLSLLRQILDIYGRYDGNSLEKLTHQEDPWKKARGDAKPLDTVNTEIKDSDMFEYYAKLATQK